MTDPTAPHTPARHVEHGRALRALRIAAGMSRADVARQALVGQSYLADVENGRETAPPRWLGMVTGVIVSRLATSTD